MKRCDICIHWIPRQDIGFCPRANSDKVDADDCCDSFTSEEDKNKEERRKLYLELKEEFEPSPPSKG